MRRSQRTKGGATPKNFDKWIAQTMRMARRGFPKKPKTAAPRRRSNRNSARATPSSKNFEQMIKEAESLARESIYEEACARMNKHTGPRFRLLDLPPELRMKIFDFMLSRPDPLHLQDLVAPLITAVSKQVRGVYGRLLRAENVPSDSRDQHLPCSLHELAQPAIWVIARCETTPSPRGQHPVLARPDLTRRTKGRWNTRSSRYRELAYKDPSRGCRLPQRPICPQRRVEPPSALRIRPRGTTKFTIGLEDRRPKLERTRSHHSQSVASHATVAPFRFMAPRPHDNKELPQLADERALGSSQE
jgi:hypothetical protein